MTQPPVFDGHNDALLRLWSLGRGNEVAAFKATDKGHIDLTRAAKGGFAGGFFAMFVPPMGRGFDMSIFGKPPYDVPLPKEISQDIALRIVVEQAGVLHRLVDQGLAALCTSSADIDAAIEAGRMAVVLHVEGAEAIDADLKALDGLYAMGLRSIGPVWSRPTVFGHGVPFRYPSDGDIGPGLTEAGKALVAECLARRIVVDTSHLNVKGFNDVGEIGAPLVATHSNAHAISPGARNLTDTQLKMIGETGGMVGLNFGTMFLRRDGKAGKEGAFEAALDHLDHMIAVAGEDHVGLGSDYDGAPMPPELASVADLGNLRKGMADRGYGAELIAKICHENWRAFLRRYWENR
ncbi:MAG: membrane dipeptidase [Rhodobacteraceae bacterium]|nr:membrane dipeptidase [Paracoccaceae bacterium]